jgi:hypothetical protein
VAPHYPFHRDTGRGKAHGKEYRVVYVWCGVVSLAILDKCTEDSLPGRMDRAVRLDRGLCRGNGRNCREEKMRRVDGARFEWERWKGDQEPRPKKAGTKFLSPSSASPSQA